MVIWSFTPGHLWPARMPGKLREPTLWAGSWSWRIHEGRQQLRPRRRRRTRSWTHRWCPWPLSRPWPLCWQWRSDSVFAFLHLKSEMWMKFKFSVNRNMFGKDHLWRCEVWSIALTFIVFWILTGDCSIALIFNSILLLFPNWGFEASLMMGWKHSVDVEQQKREREWEEFC